MQDIKIIVPAVPVAQPRPRVCLINGQARAVSNPAKHPVTAYKATCRLAAQQAYSGPPLAEPLCLTLLFVLPRPQSKVWKKKPMPREPHIGRGDLDNFEKGTIDALTGILWTNDNLIYRKHSTKVIASCDEQPHVEITVWKPEE